MGDYRGIRVNKVWITRKETASFTIGGQTQYYESSIGLGIESDNPAHSSRDLYDGAHRALNLLFERERKNWLSAKVASIERDRIDAELAVAQAEWAAAHPSAEEAIVSSTVPLNEQEQNRADGVPDLTIQASAAVSSDVATPEHLKGECAF